MTHNLSPQTDARGVVVSECKPSSLEDYERALYQFQSYFGDPTETLAATVENDPEFVMGHVFNASAMLMMTERQYIPAIRHSIERAESLSHKSNDREKELITAARDCLEGRWDRACVAWDRVLARYPRDAMAIQCAHLMDFFRGDAVNLRDRVGRVIQHWHESVPGYSYILGMQAFGFEECNQYDKAEETANKALEIERRDGWSVHALAHVMEMQGRYEEGKDLMLSREQDWAPDNGFASHNWWHLALFHIEHEDFPSAVRLYDEKVIPEDSDITARMLDATALLWRLHLQGVDDVYDLEWAPGVVYREVRYQEEVEQTKYAFGMIDMSETDFAAFHRDLFDKYQQMSETLVRSGLVFPALDACLKCSHTFNLLDASGGIGVTERAAYILRVRQLAVAIARVHIGEPAGSSAEE